MLNVSGSQDCSKLKTSGRRIRILFLLNSKDSNHPNHSSGLMYAVVAQLNSTRTAEEYSGNRRNTVETSGIRNIAKYSGNQWNTVETSGIQWKPAGYSGIQRNTAKYSGNQWNTVETSGIQRNTAEYSEIQCNTVETSGIHMGYYTVGVAKIKNILDRPLSLINRLKLVN